MRTFRKNHIVNILKNWEANTFPLDYFLSRYFRTHKSLGSHDRKEIAKTIYQIIRWQNLIDYHLSKPVTWEKRVTAYEEGIIDPAVNALLPEHLQYAFPEFLYNFFIQDYGKQKAHSLMSVLQQSAPLTIRVNSIKCKREELLKRWQNQFSIKPSSFSSMGISFSKRESLFHLQEFKKGFFEVQDEGSQLVADQVEAKPGLHILDYCGGSGGKTLAFAPKMQGKGQIYLHDIRPSILYQAKKRMKRAGVQNTQLLFPNKGSLKKYYGKMDIVLVDVPCSGVGTLRRNPEQKWKLSQETIENLVTEQREIFTKALDFVKPEGKIIYATCSILSQENENQVDFFTHNLPVKLAKKPMKWLPTEGGMDGFFAAHFQRNG